MNIFTENKIYPEDRKFSPDQITNSVNNFQLIEHNDIRLNFSLDFENF